VPAQRPSSIAAPDEGWCVLVRATPTSAADISTRLAARGLAVRRVTTSGDGVAALIWPAPAAAVEHAAEALRARAASVIVLPICGLERH
jgi:hypothetical protein